MRIISGNLRGITLHLASDKTTRPLKDLARESIFNLLLHSNKLLFKIENCSVLDLYSGTGSFGLECISRKARDVCFVENQMKALEILEKNIQKLKVKKKTKIFSDDVFKIIKKNYLSKYDLIFCDPPFKNTDINELVKLIYEKRLLKKNGITILHRNKKSNICFPEYFKILDERVYGNSKIIFGVYLF